MEYIIHSAYIHERRMEIYKRRKVSSNQAGDGSQSMSRTLPW